MRPTETLGFLRYKAFLVYISNVYDNLPTDEIVRIGGHLFQVETRAYLPRRTPSRPGRELGSAPGRAAGPGGAAAAARAGAARRGLVPSTFPTPTGGGDASGARPGTRCGWRSATCRSTRSTSTRSAPDVSGELLRPIVEANGDVRMHVSNGAAASFADTLTLLHPLGMLQCHDLFVTDMHQYLTGFRARASTTARWSTGSTARCWPTWAGARDST